MKRDREPIAQGVAVHYQPQRHLLKDRIILVTGASDGIGREAALTYARYSASVILLGRNDDKLRAVAEEMSVRAAFPPAGLLSTCSPARRRRASSWRSRSASTIPALTACCTTRAARRHLPDG
jgi:NAD(P)-dependent dehydrogenase (short-subunit alcohol dehydrogenase family)